MEEEISQEDEGSWVYLWLNMSDENIFPWQKKKKKKQSIIASPQKFHSFIKITQVACGIDFAAFLSYEGKAYNWLWGTKKSEQSGEEGHEAVSKNKQNKKEENDEEDLFYNSSPQLMEGNGFEFLRVTSISAAYHHLACLTDEGKVYMIGSNEAGQKFGTYENQKNKKNSFFFDCTPQEVTLKSKVVQISCNSNYSLFLSDKGVVYALGEIRDTPEGEEEEELAHGRAKNLCTTNSIVYNKMTALNFDEEKITNVSAGDSHALALTEEGRVYSWGSNKHGQLGICENKKKKKKISKAKEKSEGEDEHRGVDDDGDCSFVKEPSLVMSLACYEIRKISADKRSSFCQTKKKKIFILGFDLFFSPYHVPADFSFSQFCLTSFGAAFVQNDGLRMMRFSNDGETETRFLEMPQNYFLEEISFREDRIIGMGGEQKGKKEKSGEVSEEEMMEETEEEKEADLHNVGGDEKETVADYRRSPSLSSDTSAKKRVTFAEETLYIPDISPCSSPRSPTSSSCSNSSINKKSTILKKNNENECGNDDDVHTVNHTNISSDDRVREAAGGEKAVSKNSRNTVSISKGSVSPVKKKGTCLVSNGSSSSLHNNNSSTSRKQSNEQGSKPPLQSCLRKNSYMSTLKVSSSPATGFSFCPSSSSSFASSTSSSSCPFPSTRRRSASTDLPSRRKSVSPFCGKRTNDGDMRGGVKQAEEEEEEKVEMRHENICTHYQQRVKKNSSTCINNNNRSSSTRSPLPHDSPVCARSSSQQCGEEKEDACNGTQARRSRSNSFAADGDQNENYLGLNASARNSTQTSDGNNCNGYQNNNLNNVSVNNSEMNNNNASNSPVDNNMGGTMNNNNLNYCSYTNNCNKILNGILTTKAFDETLYQKEINELSTALHVSRLESMKLLREIEGFKLQFDQLNAILEKETAMRKQTQEDNLKLQAEIESEAFQHHQDLKQLVEKLNVAEKGKSAAEEEKVQIQKKFQMVEERNEAQRSEEIKKLEKVLKEEKEENEKLFEEIRKLEKAIKEEKEEKEEIRKQAKSSISEWQKAHDVLQNAVATKNHQITLLNNQIKQLQHDASQKLILESKIEELEAKLKKNEILEIEVQERYKLEEKVTRYEEKIEEMKEEVNTANTETLLLRQQNFTITEERDNIKEENSKLQNDIKRLEQEEQAQQSELKDLQQQLLEAQKEASDAETARMKLENEILEERFKVDELASEKELLTKQLSNMENECKIMKNEKKAMQNSEEKARESYENQIYQLNEQLTQANKIYDKAHIQIKELQNDICSHRNAANDLQKKLVQIKNEKLEETKKFEEQIAALNTQNAELLEKISQLSVELTDRQIDSDKIIQKQNKKLSAVESIMNILRRHKIIDEKENESQIPNDENSEDTLDEAVLHKQLCENLKKLTDEIQANGEKILKLMKENESLKEKVEECERRESQRAEEEEEEKKVLLEKIGMLENSLQNQNEWTYQILQSTAASDAKSSEESNSLKKILQQKMELIEHLHQQLSESRIEVETLKKRVMLKETELNSKHASIASPSQPTYRERRLNTLSRASVPPPSCFTSSPSFDSVSPPPRSPRLPLVTSSPSPPASSAPSPLLLPPRSYAEIHSSTVRALTPTPRTTNKKIVKKEEKQEANAAVCNDENRNSKLNNTGNDRETRGKISARGGGGGGTVGRAAGALKRQKTPIRSTNREVVKTTRGENVNGRREENISFPASPPSSSFSSSSSLPPLQKSTSNNCIINLSYEKSSNANIKSNNNHESIIAVKANSSINSREKVADGGRRKSIIGAGGGMNVERTKGETQVEKPRPPPLLKTNVSDKRNEQLDILAKNEPSRKTYSDEVEEENGNQYEVYNYDDDAEEKVDRKMNSSNMNMNNYESLNMKHKKNYVCHTPPTACDSAELLNIMETSNNSTSKLYNNDIRHHDDTQSPYKNVHFSIKNNFNAVYNNNNNDEQSIYLSIKPMKSINNNNTEFDSKNCVNKNKNVCTPQNPQKSCVLTPLQSSIKINKELLHTAPPASAFFHFERIKEMAMDDNSNKNSEIRHGHNIARMSNNSSSNAHVYPSSRCNDTKYNSDTCSMDDQNPEYNYNTYSGYNSYSSSPFYNGGGGGGNCLTKNTTRGLGEKLNEDKRSKGFSILKPNFLQKNLNEFHARLANKMKGSEEAGVGDI